jgi:hypothetical protein
MIHASHNRSWRLTCAGYLLSGMGLGSFGWGVGRTITSWRGGLPASPSLMVALVTAGLLLGGMGFALLVVSSNPFDESDSPP